MYSCKFALKEVSRINILAILYQTLIVFNRLLSSIFATYVNKVIGVSQLVVRSTMFVENSMIV